MLCLVRYLRIYFRNDQAGTCLGQITLQVFSFVIHFTVWLKPSGWGKQQWDEYQMMNRVSVQRVRREHVISLNADGWLGSSKGSTYNLSKRGQLQGKDYIRILYVLTDWINSVSQLRHYSFLLCTPPITFKHLCIKKKIYSHHIM